MKGFSFKVLYLSVFAPSIIYVVSLPYLELWFQRTIASTIQQKLIRNDFELLQGKVTLYDEINRNVSAVLAQSLAVRMGTEVSVRITDSLENVIYPYYEHLLAPFRTEETLGKKTGPLFDEKGLILDAGGGNVEEFLQNFSDYIHGMKVAVTTKVPVTSWVGSSLLLFYILGTVMVLYFYYLRMSALEQKRLTEISERLEDERRTVSEVESELTKARERLAGIQVQEEEWLKEVERLEFEKNQLETELLETLEETEEQKELIDALEVKVNKKAEPGPKRARDEERLLTRFAKLYRNLEMDRKAVADITRIGDEKVKLQAEEILKRLNDADPTLKVRRRIAGVEKCDAYELGFGSSGRIYYIKAPNGRYRVLRIGTKATQKKDLAYLQGRTK